MRKIVNLIMILVLTFAFTFALPQKEAEAVVWAGAVPAGITVGAGAYTVGALALGAVVGIAGYDTYSEEINAHALRAWGNGTQLAKDSMNAMITSAVGLGNALTSVDADFNTWMESQINNLALDSVNIANPIISLGIATTYENAPATSIPKVILTATGADELGNKFFYNGVASKANYAEMRVNTSNVVTFNYAGKSEQFYGSTGQHPYTQTAIVAMINSIGSLADFNNMRYLFYKNAPTLGYSSIPLTTAQHQTVYAEGVSKVREAWQDMKDAGLVLPVDSAIPVYQGNAVNYNAQTDVYTGVDGGVINPADVTWSFPQPRIRTGEELDVTVPTGVYVDNPAGVYNPSLPDTLVVPDVAIPTTTNITTGVTTEIPKTGTGDPPATGGTTPKGEPINPFKVKPMPIAALTGLFQLLAALIFYLIRLFTFIATIAFIAPTPIDNPYFLWFIDATFYGIKPFPLVQNLALFFLGFSVYRSVRRVFG